ncbi:MAG: protease Lon-related BREX system protein BrxL [Clostridiales bacterium]|jgi:ATP-dependent Lon protease|nr:protease Lon-related BREX system protein BrxL [Clostridiales bacterium]
MSGLEITSDARETIKAKLRAHFDGKIVRKDLTKKIKEGANVPIYVLEFLLGQYCSSDDDAIIETGVQQVKRILADNFVRPDESQKILSQLRKRGSHTVIDMITVQLDIQKNRYFAQFSNLGLARVPIEDEYPEKYDRLLCGGIWCIVQLDYESVEEAKKNGYPIQIRKLTPIQMPHIDIDDLKAGRKAFTKEEWMDVLLRSIGMEPDALTMRGKWLLILRMVPLAENNFNLCELGPRSTGKSHLFKEISPNSILVSGGQTTVANLFYNMARKTVGLVGLWDCVAFDEVAGISFKDKDGIQIMKDYMASGSFARGKEEKAASASMVFVGNINQSVDVLLKTSSLFDPFPPEMGTDTAFLDRIHCYLPGWEIPKFRPEHFTDDYGFITDYLAEFIRDLRKEQYGDALDRWFRLGKNLNQRDTIAVRRTVDGLLKLVYPNGEFTKEELAEILKIALEMRRRVKEQLKKLGGMEFYDVNFSYIDNETFEEHYVSVPEQGGGKLIPEGLCNPGQVYTVSRGKSGMIGVFRLESQMLPGNGKFDRTGIGTDRDARESSSTAFNFLKANGNRISGSISTTTKDYIINYQDLQGIGMTGKLALPSLIALCSIALGRPTLGSLAVLGEISISGTMMKVDELANTLQCCLDSGAKKVLIPSVSMIDFAAVPADLMGAFQLIPYSSAEDAVFKALGVE